MFGKRIPLFKIFGFQIGIDYSWFFLAVQITWSFIEFTFWQMEAIRRFSPFSKSL